MNIGEKITSYKEKLGFRDYKEFSSAAGVSNSWLLELSKKTEVLTIDINNLIKLCDYLNVDIQQLIKDDDVEEINSVSIDHITDCNDIGILLKELATLANQTELKMDGVVMNARARAIFKDSLYAVTQLTKQHL